MHFFIQTLFMAALVVAAPAIDSQQRNNIEKRTSTCTFTAASAASLSIKSCATAVLDSIKVPAGTTLDLSKAADNTHVRPVSPLLTSHVSC